jgi:hypothetical protein
MIATTTALVTMVCCMFCFCFSLSYSCNESSFFQQAKAHGPSGSSESKFFQIACGAVIPLDHSPNSFLTTLRPGYHCGTLVLHLGS